MRAACRDVEGAGDSKFIIINVNKRVNAKFYGVSSINNLQGAENPVPGSLVDENVCTTQDGNDFFIVS